MRKTAALLCALALPGASVGVVVASSASQTRLTARLSGFNGVPMGDRDGSGRAIIRPSVARARICFELSWRNIATPTAAHIHRGARGVAGPVVVPLATKRKGCTRGVGKRLVRRIVRRPRDYYVNVHNGPYPGGAIRGQLRKAS